MCRSVDTSRCDKIRSRKVWICDLIGSCEYVVKIGEERPGKGSEHWFGSGDERKPNPLSLGFWFNSNCEIPLHFSRRRGSVRVLHKGLIEPIGPPLIGTKIRYCGCTCSNRTRTLGREDSDSFSLSRHRRRR